MMIATCGDGLRFGLASVDPSRRVKLIGFRRHGVRPHTPQLIAPPPEAMHGASELFRDVAPFDLRVI